MSAGWLAPTAVALSISTWPPLIKRSFSRSLRLLETAQGPGGKGKGPFRRLSCLGVSAVFWDDLAHHCWHGHLEGGLEMLLRVRPCGINLSVAETNKAVVEQSQRSCFSSLSPTLDSIDLCLWSLVGLRIQVMHFHLIRGVCAQRDTGVSEVILFLSFCVWFVYIYTYICVCIYHIFFIHSSTDELLYCFHVLTIMNNAVIASKCWFQFLWTYESESESHSLWPPWTIVHGILQARILEWVAVPFSRGSFQPRDWTQVSHIAGGFFTSWATGEAQK